MYTHAYIYAPMTIHTHAPYVYTLGFLGWRWNHDQLHGNFLRSCPIVGEWISKLLSLTTGYYSELQ